LHEANLTNSSNRTRVITTLDLRYRVRNVRRKPHLLGFTPDCRKMSLAPWGIGLGHPDEALDDGRQGDIWEVD
jgi:hypothetical protein